MLNAFRHHRGRHQELHGRFHDLCSVLNAFRHHRGRHGAERGREFGNLLCSTPFGITEVGTSRSGSQGFPGDGAQRLSASQRSARAHLGPHVSAFPVLNAFRHHRGRHRRPSVGQAGWPSAQRLSASQRSAHAGWPSSSSPTASAQRLSASQRSAPLLAEESRRARECSTPFGITEVGTQSNGRSDLRGRDVLNAFRHHRGRHVEVGGCLPFHDWCSTPFGITEVGT